MSSTKQIDQRYQTRPKPDGLRFGIVEVTTHCQYRCPGCYMVRRNHLNHGAMSLEQAVRVLDLCLDYIGRELETMDILGGEPLLWPHLKEYIEVLLNKGIQPWIFTNMAPATPELASWLWDRQVHVSGKLNVDPCDKSQHALQAEMIGATEAAVQKMLQAISIFQQAGYQDPLFRLQNLVRKANIDLVPAYYRWCLQNNIGTDLELMGSGETIDQVYWEVAPTPAQIAQMIKEVQTVRAEFGLPEAEVLMPHVFGSCPFYDRGLYFGVDGHIRACSNSTVVLSHIDKTDPIRQAFESELICNRLSLSQDRVGEPCHSCDRWEKCRGGCRATTEGLGDPFGGYPICPLPYL